MPPTAHAQTMQIPFTAAAHRYVEKIWTKQWQQTAAGGPIDLSPPGFAIKSYGYLRAIFLKVSTATVGVAGTYTAGGDSPWNLISQVAVTQPNGEEMFGGPTFSGYHSMIAAKHSAWRGINDPALWPSFSNSVTSPQFFIPISFEINPEYGLASLPNQDFSAPWKLQVTANTAGGVYSANPTTFPLLQLDVFIYCWTVPSQQNPLNPQVGQETAPALLGTLNKWTVQQYTVPVSSTFNVLLQRKGNAIRNLVCILRAGTGLRVATTNFPSPLSIRWDGTVIRASDDPVRMVDDEYATMIGRAGSTPQTPDAGVIVIQMADVSGIDAQGPAEGYGMNGYWGTVQSSTLEIDGTWGAAGGTLEVLTNDVQFVNLAGNPYAFAYAGYLQAPAQPIARP
jgi:hypothetical protein